MASMTTPTHARREVRWSPDSRRGQWAVAMAGCTIGGVVLLVLGFASGVVEPADSYADGGWQALWGLFIWASAIAALVVGTLAVRRAHERSWLVRGAIAVGLLPPVLLVSEIALGKF